MTLSSALPVFPLNIETGPGLVPSRQGANLRLDLERTALLTTGSGNDYRVDTGGRIKELRGGIELLIEADRTNTGPCFLIVDCFTRRPLLDAGGAPQVGDRVVQGRFYSVLFSDADQAFRVQAGASTLDEIPGLIELRQEVAAKTNTAIASAEAAQADAEIATARAAQVETARNQVAANTAQVATQADQVAASTTVAQAARDQAVANAVAGSLRFPTRAALLAYVPPDQTKLYYADVDQDDGLNGRYAWNGAAPWTRVSSATLPSVDARLASREGLDGPSVGWLSDVDTNPAPNVVLDQMGAGLSYVGADGRRRVPGSGGLWMLDGGPESGPSHGWLDDDVPVASTVLDDQGRGISATKENGRGLVPDGYGDWRAPEDGIAGPEIGWLYDAPMLASAAVTDSNGAPLLALGPDGQAYAPDLSGAYRLLAVPEDGPGLGWIDEGDDALIDSATLDADGRIQRAAATGSRECAVAYVAAPGGMARIETPLDLPNQVRAGPALVVPPVRLRRAWRWIWTKAAVVISPAPATEAVSSASYTLRYANPVFLDHQYVRGTLTMRRESDNAILVEGTDYRLDADRGVITGLVNTADTPVTISYTGALIRVDYISANPADRTPVLSQGTARRRVASLFPPVLPGGHQLLFRVYRWADGADLSPAHLYRDRVRIDRQADIEADIARNRRRTARIRRKLASQATFKWGGYGDSITQMGYAPNPADVNTTPGGPYRDVVGYFDLYDAAARALIPTSDLGDGMGQIHVREGWNHRAIAWAQRVYGSTVNYRNWGISGTDSSNGMGGGYMNGSYPDRLAALVADGCDLVVCAFGQNELGSTASYANNGAIWQALLNAGADVIGVTPTRPHPRFQDRVEAWRFTCSELLRLGDDLGVAVVDTSRLFDPTRIGGLGLAEAELSEASMQNHPGRLELRAVGDLITELL